MTHSPTTPRPQGNKLPTPVIIAIAVGTAVALVCGVCMASAIVSNKGNDTTSVAGDETTSAGAVHATTSSSTSPLAVPAATTGQESTPIVGATTASTTTGEMIVVPNGVGLDYQSAQDIWRAAGLHVAPAIDALGAHRLPVIDSNWVVLSQDPEAGAVVQRDSFITATVKKYTDD